MSEVAKIPQFVGSSEAGKSQEFSLNPEQQRVVDTMKSSREVLEKKVLDARGNAGEKLKELKGKELVKAGLKQTAIGLFGGKFVEAVTGGIGGAVAGGISVKKHKENLGFKMGMHTSTMSPEDLGKGGWKAKFNKSWKAMDDNFQRNAEGLDKKWEAGIQVDRDASMGYMLGKAVGIEASGLAYAAAVKNTDLPRLKWYDWVGGQLGLILPIGINPINVVTFGGIRNTITGLLHMARGQ